jgi:hypothetical protein
MAYLILSLNGYLAGAISVSATPLCLKAFRGHGVAAVGAIDEVHMLAQGYRI